MIRLAQLVSSITAAGLAILLAGCAAHHNPVSVRFTGCKVVATSTDAAGNQRKDCDCLHPKQIGVDARTKAAIIRCE